MPDSEKYVPMTEKAMVSSVVGSFWTKNIAEDARGDVHSLTHIPHQTDAPALFRAVAASATGACRRIVHGRALRFSDADIDGNTLRVDPDVLVTSIKREGAVLVRNRDFNSSYGTVAFASSPMALFPSMQFLARSLVIRTPNVLCYPLGIGPVYGPVGRVVDYFRRNQSPLAFYRAAAQAAGMAVVEADSAVASANDGTYIDTKGRRYDAGYPHTAPAVGDTLTAGEVVGAENFYIVLPGDPVPSGVEKAVSHSSCAVNGLEIPNGVVTLYSEGRFRPEYGPAYKRDLYWSFLDGLPDVPQGGEAADQNALEHFRRVVAPGRTLLYHVGTGLPRDMQVRLHAFVREHAPVGSVLLEI